MAPDKDISFSYHVHGQSSVLIISLTGEIGLNAHQALDDLRQEILGANSAKAIILNFNHVTNVTVDAYSGLTLLQQSIRKNQTELRLCSMNEIVKEKLTKAGILRSHEISEDSKQAIYSLFPGNRKSA